MNNAKQDVPELYAIVELFGHQRIAGRISEQTFGGSSFVRIDVPEVSYTEWEWDHSAEEPERRQVAYTIQAHTRSLGASAIYAINWCDATAATLAAGQIRNRPITTYDAADVLRAMKPDEVQKLLIGSTRQLDDDTPF